MVQRKKVQVMFYRFEPFVASTVVGTQLLSFSLSSEKQSRRYGKEYGGPYTVCTHEIIRVSTVQCYPPIILREKQGIELTSSTEQRDTEGIKALKAVALLLKKKIKQLVHVTFCFWGTPVVCGN